MQSFYYCKNIAGNRFGGKIYYVRKNDDGKVFVTIDEGYPLSETFTVETDIFNELQKIICEYKMHKYKRRYLTKYKVYDDNSWRFQANYANEKKNITANGENATPKNADKAFGAIDTFFQPYRNKLWQGYYVGSTDINAIELEEINDETHKYIIEIGALKDDDSIDVTFTAKGCYRILYKGIPKYKTYIHI